jgi:CRISPR-associated protein Cmr3
MRIFIQPCEVLLFRTGHPFNAGENHYADTLFPPTPETLQGAIRATIATYWNTDKTLAEVFQEPELIALIGNQEHYGRFSITNISVGRRLKDAHPTSPVERLFPMPAHFFAEENAERQLVRLLPRPHEPAISSNLPAPLQLLYPDQTVQSKLEPLRGWLTEQSLQKALHGQHALARSEIIDPTTIYVYELRQGIGITKQSKTTAEGQFYQARMLRMNHRSDDPFMYGFVVDVRLLQTLPQHLDTGARKVPPLPFIPEQHPDTGARKVPPLRFIPDEQTQHLLRLPDQGWMILGGERRAARFEVVLSSQSANEQPEQHQEGNLLYLATPAAFTRGWQPHTWPDGAPIAVAMERYQPIGGWHLAPDSNGGQSKTLRRCVPAGSIYFFNAPIRRIQSFTDYGDQIGYGITYSGVYQP